MYVVAKMEKEFLEPYNIENKVPVVIESDHPRFVEGTRLDWGFAETAIEDGYILTIIP